MRNVLDIEWRRNPAPALVFTRQHSASARKFATRVILSFVAIPWFVLAKRCRALDPVCWKSREAPRWVHFDVVEVSKVEGRADRQVVHTRRVRTGGRLSVHLLRDERHSFGHVPRSNFQDCFAVMHKLDRAEVELARYRPGAPRFVGR